MNNPLRLVLFFLVFGTMIFGQKDEPPKNRPKDLDPTISIEQTLVKRIHYGLAQKRMLRLEQSSHDDRNR